MSFVSLTEVDPLKNHLGRYPREPLKKSCKKGIGHGSKLNYEDAKAADVKPAGGDHYSAQFRYKRPLNGDLDAEQANHSAYAPYDVKPRPKSVESRDPRMNFAREVEKSMKQLWADLGSPSRSR